MQHRGSDPAHRGWTRAYTYDEASLIETRQTRQDQQPAELARRSVTGRVEPYTYDAHGSMTRMPHCR